MMISKKIDKGVAMIGLILFMLAGCSSGNEIGRAEPDSMTGEGADVVSVSVSGNEGDYRFSVEISSPDTGCGQYADWWEVVSEEGELIYRRVLLHSHVNEQPFTRSGGPVAIDANQKVWVRAHINNSGYGGNALLGSVEDGFESTEPEENFASDLENKEPLPDGCAF
mgnify:CR=1 FL=1